MRGARIRVRFAGRDHSDSTRFRHRAPRSASRTWIEVDFPDVIAYKTGQLADARPGCALQHVGVDLTDAARRRALFDQIGAAARRVLVVSEGLLIYLPPEQVAALG